MVKFELTLFTIIFIKGEWRVDIMLYRQFEVRVNDCKESSNGYVYMKHGNQYSILCKNHRSVRCNVELFIDNKSIGTWRIPANGSISIEHPLNDNGRFTFYKKGSKEAKTVDTKIADSDSGLIKAVFTPEKVFNFTPFYRNPWDYPIYPWVYPWYQWVYPWYQSPIWIIQQPVKQPDYSFDNRTIVSWGGSDNGNGLGNISCNYAAHQTNLNCFNQDAKAECDSKLEAGITGLSGHSDQVFNHAENMSLDYAEETTICLRLVARRKRGKGPRPLLATNSTPVPPPVM